MGIDWSEPEWREKLVGPRERGAAGGRCLAAGGEAVAWPQAGRTELAVGEVRIRGIRRVDDVIYFEVGPTGR